MCQVYGHDRAVVSRLVRASRAHGGCVKFLRVDRSVGAHGEIFAQAHRGPVNLVPYARAAAFVDEVYCRRWAVAQGRGVAGKFE